MAHVRDLRSPAGPGGGRLQAAAQVSQLNQKIQSQDWTGDINYRDQATGMCPACGQESGGGKFCQNCGQPAATVS
jgi:methionyl-tRNA synthetase